MKLPKFLIVLLMILLFHMGCKRDLMQVQTGNISTLLSTTVHITGYLNSAGEGIKTYGHCISLTPGPTLSDIRSEFVSTIGTGEFTSILYNLEPETTYFARAYITSGNELVYGSEITFTTTEK